MYRITTPGRKLQQTWEQLQYFLKGDMLAFRPLASSIKSQANLNIN